MEKILDFGMTKQKKIISECMDSKTLGFYVRDIESEIFQINTDISVNRVKYANNDDAAKGAEWYRLKLLSKNHLVRLKYLVVQRIAEVKKVEKANHTKLEKQPKKLADYFMQIAHDKLDDKLFQELVSEAKEMKSLINNSTLIL